MPNTSIIEDTLNSGWLQQSTTITYAYSPTYNGWSAYEQQQFELAFQVWEDVSNISFVFSNNTSTSDIVLYNVNGTTMDSLTPGSTGVLGFFYFPTPGQQTGYFNQDGLGWDQNNTSGGLEQGGYGFTTMVHELGHGLGLAHPHDDAGSSTILPGISNPFDIGMNGHNQGINSVMSYNDGLVSNNLNPGGPQQGYGWQGGPMAFDIYTIQQMYGANNNYHTGNDTYTLTDTNQTGTFYSSIWDAGGVDEIVYSGATDAYIDLRAATIDYGDPGAGGYISSVDGIYGGFTVANGVVIENASGGSGADILVGNEGANLLNGNAGNDTLAGLAGNDQLVGGAGNDRLFGDQMTVNASGISIGSGAVSVNSGSSNNSTANAIDISAEFTLNSDINVDFSTYVPHVQVTSTRGGSIEYYAIQINNVGAWIRLDIDATTNLDSFIQLLDSNGNVLVSGDDSRVDEGSEGSSNVRDSFLEYLALETGTYYIAVGAYNGGNIGPMASNAVYSLQVSVGNEMDAGIVGGDDTLEGGAGDDVLHGGAGTDTAIYSANTTGVSVNLYSGVATGDGTDTLTSIENAIGGPGDDSIWGTGGSNRLEGGLGIDHLYGGAGADMLFGDAHNDFLYGGNGNDELHGGSGFDLLNGQDGDDTIYGDGGNDTIYGLEGNDHLDGGANSDTISGGEGDDTINGGSGYDTISGQNGNDTISGGSEKDSIYGGDGDDTLMGDGGDDFINGGSGNDTIHGGIGNDIVYGMAGNDIINGNDGDDRLSGQDGDDTISGGSGLDWINGQAGRDTIYGGDDNDSIYGGNEVGLGDTIHGDAGDDNLYGQNGNDVINGGAGNDFLYGGNDNDTLSGNAGNDFLNGQYGNDVIDGGAGDDTIYGYVGTDTITGGAGDDFIGGGADLDSFIFTSGWGHDTVADFGWGGAEQMDMSVLGLAGFSDLTVNDDGSGNAFIYVTGDTANTITLTNVDFTTIDANDFVFV